MARRALSRHQHRARGARPPWPRDAPRSRAARAPRARRSAGPTSRMPCGVPTTKASSCWRTGAIATRSPSPTSPAAICCNAKRSSTTQERYAFTVFERVFKEFGLPARDPHRQRRAVRPSPNALYGLSKLSVWWLRLGLRIERIKPGHPEQNGRHERMHLTLKPRGHQARRPQFPAAASPASMRS